MGASSHLGCPDLEKGSPAPGIAGPEPDSKGAASFFQFPESHFRSARPGSRSSQTDLRDPPATARTQSSMARQPEPAQAFSGSSRPRRFAICVLRDDDVSSCRLDICKGSTARS